MKNSLVSHVLFTFIIICIIIFVLVNPFKRPIYTINYDNGIIPPTTYSIKIYSNKIKIREIESCSAVNCHEKVINKVYKYSKDDINNIKDIINKYLGTTKEINLTKDLLNDNQFSIINGLINNTKIEINDVVSSKKTNKVELLYTIRFSGIDCITPKLMLYSNGTYQYGGDNNVLKSGFYSMDILDYFKFVNDIKLHAGYVIDDNKGHSFDFSEDDQTLNDFFTSLGLSMSSCYNN